MIISTRNDLPLMWNTFKMYSPKVNQKGCHGYCPHGAIKCLRSLFTAVIFTLAEVKCISRDNTSNPSRISYDQFKVTRLWTQLPVKDKKYQVICVPRLHCSVGCLLCEGMCSLRYRLWYETLHHAGQTSMMTTSAALTWHVTRIWLATLKKHQSVLLLLLAD